MYRLALLSFHGCPVARLGEKDTGGMNVYVLQLARELGLRGVQVDVYTRFHDPQDPQVIDLGHGARVVHIKAGPYDRTKESLNEHIPEFLRNLLSFKRSESVSYDLIHSHYWLSAQVGEILSRKWGVPHIVTFHTLAKTKLRARAGEIESQLRLSVEKRVGDSADALVVFTEQEREDLARLYHISPHKMTIIPAGVDLKLFQSVDKYHARQTLGLGEENIILYVGRIEPLKGIDILINAAAILEESSETRVLIVGGRLGFDTELDRLMALASQLGIANLVTFTGTVSQAQLPKYYSAADVLVLPSYHESFGLVALEAMACGTPVVASRVGGLKTLIDNGETGYLIPWHCSEPFAQRIDVLLANPTLRDSMGKAARARALEMSWGGVADRMMAFYSHLIYQPLEGLAGG